jgi:hypothetical protein
VTEKEIEMAHHFRNMAELKEHIWRLAETARKEIEQSYGSIATAAARGNQHEPAGRQLHRPGQALGEAIRRVPVTRGIGTEERGARRSAGRKAERAAFRPLSTPLPET